MPEDTAVVAHERETERLADAVQSAIQTRDIAAHSGSDSAIDLAELTLHGARTALAAHRRFR